jgi:transcriptional regulator with XRE-family HTH domain
MRMWHSTAIVSDPTRDPTVQVQLVGRKLRRLRKERRLSQVELSARVGIQQSDLSRMERGEYRVSLDKLFKLLGEFGLSITEFFDEPVVAPSAREARLASQYRSLDPESRREVESFIAFKRQEQVEDGQVEEGQVDAVQAGASEGHGEDEGK